MEIKWISHACFKIKTKSGKILYLDPYQIPENEEKADFIVSSHNHYDHLDKGAINNVYQESTVIIGPDSISSDLKSFNGIPLKIGESYQKEDVKIELFPAYTIRKGTHPKSRQFAGIIVETEGKKIYHAGDTEKIPEMTELKLRGITVAFLPCGGTYTMDFEEACEAAIDIDPNIVIPMHNWGKDLTDFKILLNKKNPNINVEILEGTSLKL
ncbi:MAG: MBL fold metallo-hydrolase [Candidatus Lokiarchaeota archaeon]|nr:MBL fold metallo-hydrolase [Candidatus Lokiarchaeota archaeon]